MKKTWFWVLAIFVSLIMTILVMYAAPGTSIQPLILIWFLCACPGLTIMRFLRLKDTLIVSGFALALSLVVDALVAGLQIYTGIWSPPGTLLVLLFLCLTGVAIRTGIDYLLAQHSRQSPGLPQTRQG